MNQDERTPVDAEADVFDAAVKVVNAYGGTVYVLNDSNTNQWCAHVEGPPRPEAEAIAEQIAQACNAYGSTDALRSALAHIADYASGPARPTTVPGLQHIEECARAALSATECPSPTPERNGTGQGSVASYQHDGANTLGRPSTEGLREALAPNTFGADTDDDVTDWGQENIEYEARAALWRDIETAPKDGTEIIALIKWPFEAAVQRRIIYWSHPGNCVIPAYMNTWMCAVTTISQREDYIQGWAPLPPAPDAARTALAGVTAPQKDTGGEL